MIKTISNAKKGIIDPAEIGRNYQTELGAVADSKLALQQLVAAAKGVKLRDRGDLKQRIAKGKAEFAANFRGYYTPTSFRCGRNASWANSARRCPRTALS